MVLLGLMGNETLSGKQTIKASVQRKLFGRSTHVSIVKRNETFREEALRQ